MYSADEIHEKIKEIEALIRENTNPDGSLGFDAYRVMVSLELTRRMIVREENNDIAVDGQTST